jgi:hypothetical protein
MGLNAAIDVAISLILVYLVLSLIVTVVNEALASGADLRASNLKIAIDALIDSETLRNSFYDHGLISGVNDAVDSKASRPARWLSAFCRWLIRAPADVGPHVSYLSGQTFAQALLASTDTTKNLPTFADIKSAVETLPDTNIRDMLLAQMTVAGGDLEKLRNGVAAWFDSSMDRVSGLYKRHLKQISFLVGLVVVLAANADTVAITSALWNEPALRDSMVKSAEDIVANPPSQIAGAGTANQPTTTATGGPNANPPAPPATPGATTPSTGASDGNASIDRRAQQLQHYEEVLRPLPLGWSTFPKPTVLIVLVKIFGLALTAIAVSLGAPFWFDLLSMFMRVRGSGAKPKKTKIAGTT